MMEPQALDLIIAGLFGSGGIAAMVTTYLKYRENKSNIDLEREKLKVEVLSVSTEKGKTELELKQVLKKKVPLQYSHVFIVLDELEYYFMWEFKLPDLGRTMVIREMCVHKIRIWREVLKKYSHDATHCISNCKLRDTSACNRTEKQFGQMLREGLLAYRNWHRQPGVMDIYGKRAYDEESAATMDVFIPIFCEWHASREQLVADSSEYIAHGKMNEDCYGDYYDIFEVYSFAFTQMKYDAPRAMKVLNGQLTGRMFLGTKIGECN